MKKTLFFEGLAFTFLLSACGADNISEPENNNMAQSNQTLYVSMTISGDASSLTRSSASNGSPSDDETDFAAGTENHINNAYFVFYDNAGTVVGDIVPVDLTGTAIDEVATPDGSVEKAYKSVVPVSVKKGENKPTQVICYINPISPSTLQSPLSVIQTVSRPVVSTKVGDNTCFAMSNSVYYPDGEAEGSVPQVTVQIPERMLHSSREQAQAALDQEDGTVKIYVERYAAKLKFSATDPDAYKTATRVYNADGSYSVKNVTLTFKPQYWAVNAESKNSYVIKSFRQESTAGELLPDNYKYGDLNLRINPALGTDNKFDFSTALDANNAWDWNNPDLHRSFWGMSPAYFTKEYPEVSSDLSKLEVNQKYISYNELKDLGYEAGNTAPQYFKETTVGSVALDSNNPTAAVASVIYVGEYGISIDDTALADDTAFYTYLVGKVDGVEEDRPYVYFDNSENSCDSKVTGGESMLKRFFAQATILYKKVGDTYTRLVVSNAADLNALTKGLAVSEISEAVKTQYDGDMNTIMKLQANSRTLQFKNATDAAGIYILTGNGYQEIVADDAADVSNTQITLTKANVILMRQVGLAYYYTSGHAYFNIPIRHLGWYRVGNTQKNDDKIDWSKVRVGDFGLVRNHSYTIDVTKISGLASGIGGDDVPIVPPVTPTDYYTAYAVKILKWAVVPTQSVELK